MARNVKVPGPEHPITVEKSTVRVRVSVGGDPVADSVSALVLKEASYPEVYYLPRADIDDARLVRSETRTYCPYKGDCTYFSVRTEHGLVDDAAWCYEDPFGAVRDIAGHLAFYPDRAEVVVDRLA